MLARWPTIPPAAAPASTSRGVAREGAPPRPEAIPLRFELDPDGAPRGAVRVLDDGREVPRTRPVTTIGRGKPSDVVIPDSNPGRLTCPLEFGPDGGCFVVDLHGACGVVVDDRRLARAGLHVGDRILLADRVLVVERR